jgi:hypothetical protein
MRAKKKKKFQQELRRKLQDKIGDFPRQIGRLKFKSHHIAGVSASTE